MMRSTLITILFLLTFVSSHAQWTQTNGPFGGDIRSFASKGNDLFVGTATSWIWHSTNNGNTWSQLNLPTGPTNSPDKGALDLIFKDSLLFASDGWYVYRSPDNGNTWILASSGINHGGLTSLEVLDNDIFTAAWGGGVFRSSDNGNSWVLVNNGLTGLLTVQALIAVGNNIYAGTSYEGVFKSTDNGNTWTSDSVGLNGADIRCLAKIGSIVYAGAHSGVFRLLGGSWDDMDNGLTHSNITSLTSSGTNLIAGSSDGYISYSSNSGYAWSTSVTRLNYHGVQELGVHNNNIYAGTYGAGVFRSPDFGISWTQSDTNIINSKIISMVSLDSTIIAGTFGNGIQISNDQGNTWNKMNVGLGDWDINSLTIIDTTIFAGTQNGIFRSDDHCNSWVFSGIYPPQNHVTGILQNGQFLFAGVFGDGVFRSQDNGVTWFPKNNGITNPQGTTLAVKDTCMFAGTGDGVFFSADYGNSWVPVNNGIVNLNIVSIHVIGNTVYANPSSGPTYRSIDNGNTWLPIGNVFPHGATTWGVSGSNIFAGNYNGIYRSTDNGSTWTPQNAGLQTNYRECNSLIILDSVVYAGIESWGVYKYANLICNNTSQTINPIACGLYTSPSGNYTWTLSGMYNDTILNAAGCDSIITINLAILPAPVVTITAIGSTTFCQGDSVILSATPGNTNYQWYRWNSLIAGATSQDYTAKSRGKYKCIAQNAVLCTDTSNAITVNVPCMPPHDNQQRVVENGELSNATIQIFPNPGSGIFTIQSPAGKLQIFNSIGELIFSKEVNKEETIVDISSFSDGIYLVILNTESHSFSRKILLSR